MPVPPAAAGPPRARPAAASPSAATSVAPEPSATPSAEPIGGSITIYNAQHESLTQAWVDEFTKQTGVQVTLRNGDDSELGNLLVQEGAASPADVFLTENSPAMALVENAGLFAPVDQGTLDQVPAAYRPSTGAWTGIAARSTVFAYNDKNLAADQLPASIMDLQDPAWKGRWARITRRRRLPGHRQRDAGARGRGCHRDVARGDEDELHGLSRQPDRDGRGERRGDPGGVIYHYYWFGDQANTGENSGNVTLHYFKNQDPGAFVSVSGGGVLQSSKNAAAAQAFLRFVTGVDGQTILQTGDSFEYAIASDVAANPALVPLVDLQAPTIDPSSLDSKEVTDLMTKAGLL